MDEATSQLDATNEATLRDFLKDVATTTTVVVVTHRVTTARAAGRIVLIQDGRLRSAGSYGYQVGEDDHGINPGTTFNSLLGGAMT
jgi:ATP-binding cassette subfamily B protein